MKGTEMRKSAAYGLVAGTAFLLISGIITGLIPTNLFLRMTPITYADYIILFSTSILTAVFAMLYMHHGNALNSSCKIPAAGGGIAGFFGFSCPLCNKLLIILLGSAGVLSYVEPFRIPIGFLGILVLGYASLMKAHSIMKR